MTDERLAQLLSWLEPGVLTHAPDCDVVTFGYRRLCSCSVEAIAAKLRCARIVDFEDLVRSLHEARQEIAVLKGRTSLSEDA